MPNQSPKQSAVVTVEIKNSIAIITIDNPPVNAIGHAVRQGIVDEVTKASGNEAVKAIVLTCAGRTFMAGADIKEFGKPPVEPFLPDVVKFIEAANKPVVAAIHGQALGGGLEIALGCHYRVAAQSAKLGLPEVLLGLIPGAGGTQRLPRLIGAEAALDMITSGKPVNATKAEALGLVDLVSEGDLVTEATVFASSCLKVSELEKRRLSSLAVAPVADGFFDSKRAELAKRRRGFEAPQACVNAVEAAATMSFAKGAERERELFMECRASSQSKAQQHMFFAERACMKVKGLDKNTPVRELKTIGIIGAGTMGGGIAMACLDAGYSVTLLEINPDNLAAGMARILKTYDGSIAKGRIDEAGKADRMGRLKGTGDYGDLSNADLIIEAAFEKMDVKQAIFKELNAIAKPDCILATNTSYLDVNAIAQIVDHPENVLGLHFFSPANIMKLLEIVRADKTADEVLHTALKFAKSIGKIGVVSGVCHGFIGNRMYQGYQREVGLLMLEGASLSQIDKALTDFGMPMGPVAVMDLSGIDIGCMMRAELPTEQFETRAFEVHDRLVNMGRLGQKTKAGFYTYAEGSRKGVEDPSVQAVIDDVTIKHGFQRRQISDEEIVERCIFALVNEGANILADGIAQLPSDIDVVFVNGYGFPRWRGGPMHYAQTLGYDKVLSRITEFCDAGDPRWWTPSKWLVDAAKG